MLSEPGLGQQPGPLILVWNGYQEKDALWAVVMERVTGGECAARCRVTRDRGRQSEAAAILFHLPNLHWEGYSYPARRDLTVPWILMTYESANSVRERAANWGRFPALTGKHINNVFNRTVSFRRDSDVVVRHGVVSRRVQPLTPAQLQRAYSGQQSRDFSNYTAGNAEPDFSTQKNIFLAENFQAGQVGRLAPVVWFVSHCKDYNGRMKYVRRLQRYIGVDIYGDCGPLRCGSTRSMGHAYSLHQDPCFNLVNRKYK